MTIERKNIKIRLSNRTFFRKILKIVILQGIFLLHL